MPENDASRLYRDTMALAGVLLQELERGQSHAVLRERLGRGALRLLDFVSLALQPGRRRVERAQHAGQELLMLRTQLRLGHALAIVDEETFLALGEQCERIARSLAALHAPVGARARNT